MVYISGPRNLAEIFLRLHDGIAGNLSLLNDPVIGCIETAADIVTYLIPGVIKISDIA